jgi:hypothetical protein
LFSTAAGVFNQANRPINGGANIVINIAIEKSCFYRTGDNSPQRSEPGIGFNNN